MVHGDGGRFLSVMKPLILPLPNYHHSRPCPSKPVSHTRAVTELPTDDVPGTSSYFQATGQKDSREGGTLRR